MTTNVVAGEGNHLVIFYPEDRDLIDSAGEFLREGLADGGSAIVVATAAHRLALDARLGCAGVDVGAAMAAGTYVELDAAETLSQFMINDRADPAAFWEVISPLLEQAGNGGKPVRVYGEMVALLWAAGNMATAIDVEALWNEMASRFSFSLLCGYPAHAAAGADVRDAVTQVCLAHSEITGTLPVDAKVLPG